MLEEQNQDFPQGNARILCHPICSGEGDLEAVVEFVRTHGNAFTEDEIEVQSLMWNHPGSCLKKVNSYLMWGGPSLYFADQIARLHQEKYDMKSCHRLT